MPEDLQLKPGEAHTFELKGRGSAGYSWAYEISGDRNCVDVKLESANQAPGNGSTQSPGTYSVDEQITVTAISPGDATIRVFLRRSWEKDKQPLEEKTIRLTVRD
jgi:predicted secreted protein